MNDDIFKRTLDKLDQIVGPDGVKVAVQPDTSKLDVIELAKANPIPTVIGLGLAALVVRKLVQ